MRQEMTSKFKHLHDDRIGDGVYVAFEWIHVNGQNKLSRIYIGSKACGPMLQYDSDGKNKYTGESHNAFKNGCWTNCYSRGNFGKKYACGGNWSGHTNNLHPRLKLSPIIDKKHEMMLDDGNNVIPIPDGIKGDISVTDMDCSGSWSIWYSTAREAIDARLARIEIFESSLPMITKNHLIKNQTHQVIDAINDVIDAYNL